MAVERRRYRKVLTRMHGDEKYRELSKPKPNGQTLWQYLITGPHTTAVPGLFTAGEAGMAEALEWPLAGFRRAWKEIESREMAHADWRARVVWLPNAVRHNVPESPNVVRSWRTTLDEIPECTLKTRALIDLAAFLEGYGPAFLKAFNEATGHPSPNQEQEQEQEQEASRAQPSPPKPPRAVGRSDGVLAGSLPRDHISHAACDPTLSRCVPAAVHAKLKGLLAPKFGGDRDKADAVLRAWYDAVWLSLPADFVMPDAFRFWQPRFDAEFASIDTAVPRGKPEPVSTVPNVSRTEEYLRRQREGR
jgi:hypothetical protein